MKLRIGNPNATGQTINGRLLQQWLREMSPTPVYIETLQEIHTAELTPIKVTDMTQLFYLNSNLTHLDISNFETKNVESMQQMFNGASSLKELDLSHFDTHNVRNVHRMFANMANLERLDISNFDSQHLQSVEYMFLGSNSLKILSLGHRFEFITPPPPLSGASLVQVPTNSLYSGKWQDVGTGSISKPEGSNVLTSEELMEQYNGETISGTYVWQPVIQ